MRLAFDQGHPEGIFENSPAFQRRVFAARGISPEGTAEGLTFSRPFGTQQDTAMDPGLKPWAIFGCPSGTGAEPDRFHGGHASNRWGIGAMRYAPSANAPAQ